MDVQMPRLDGLETTRRLRAGGGPNARTPVVALTANAFVEDVARCREAGMDAHIAKPVRAATLRSAVEAILSGRLPVAPGRPAPEAMSPEIDGPVIDENAIAALEADMPAGAVRALVRSFRVEQGRQVAELRTMLARGDSMTLARTAHSIKGAARLFGAEMLASLASDVERRAKDGTDGALAAPIEALDSAFHAVDAALHARFGKV